MAINFPASPTVGQIYTSGGMSYMWDGAKWKSLGVDVLARSQNLADLPDPATARANLKIPSVYMRATRNVGAETFPIGVYPLLGIFVTNRGGWTVGAGNTVGVPVSGMYRITNRLYVHAASTGARVGVAVNGAGTIAFCHLSTGFVGTIEGSEFYYLTAGDRLNYQITSATAYMYTAAQHTEVMAELMEAY